MTQIKSTKIHLMLAASLALATGITANTFLAKPAQAITVFDPWNYKENLLTAIRSLEEINNQVKQLTNEAQMLMKMDLNLHGRDQGAAGSSQWPGAFRLGDRRQTQGPVPR
jgi:type IV secretion system protein TrbJ